MRKNVVKAIVVFLLCGVVVFVSGVIFKMKKPAESSKSDFFAPQISNEQKILELWYVETFEGGASSRSAWLNNVAVEFEKENSGQFVLVKSITESELAIHLANGEFCDLICFGSGISENLENSLYSLTPEDYKISQTNLKNSAIKNGNLLAVPIMFNGYALISTELENLSENLFTSGEIIEQRRGNKKIYSCIYGGKNRVGAQNVINLKSAESEMSIYPESYKLSTFEAYSNFNNGKAKILIGTLRDVFRMQNKLDLGVIDKLTIEPLSSFTDLVCYLSIGKTISEDKLSVAESFLKFVLSDKIQTSLNLVGQFSPCKDIFNDGILDQLENVYSNAKCPNLF
ncbi:MAG: hypothetical protein K6F08_03780 [bacterium]|nr:hypothetical protein [bacterium]